MTAFAEGKIGKRENMPMDELTKQTQNLEAWVLLQLVTGDILIPFRGPWCLKYWGWGERT